MKMFTVIQSETQVEWYKVWEESPETVQGQTINKRILVGLRKQSQPQTA